MTGRIKGIVGAGAVGLLAVGLVAPATAQDGTSLEMIAAQYTDEMQPYFDDLAARFTEANPDIDVTVQVVSWNDIDQTVKTRVATGELPDIANLNYFASFAADDLLYTADQIVARRRSTDIIQAFRDNSMYDGIEYAVPDLASDRLFFYNKDILKAAGVEVPATWSELLAACDTIKATQPGIIPIGDPARSRGGPGRVPHLGRRQRRRLLQDGENGWSTPRRTSRRSTSSKQLVDNGCTQPNPGTTDRTNGAWPLFAQGVAAMTNGADLPARRAR